MEYSFISVILNSRSKKYFHFYKVSEYKSHVMALHYM